MNAVKGELLDLCPIGNDREEEDDDEDDQVNEFGIISVF